MVLSGVMVGGSLTGVTAVPMVLILVETGVVPPFTLLSRMTGVSVPPAVELNAPE